MNLQLDDGIINSNRNLKPNPNTKSNPSLKPNPNTNPKTTPVCILADTLINIMPAFLVGAEQLGGVGTPPQSPSCALQSGFTRL